MRQHGVDPVARPGDGAVHPLARQKKRALHAPVLHRASSPAQGGGVVKAGKVVQGGDDQHGPPLRPAPEFKRLA
jgi:hypothetical protein